ncbi:MAG: hypothetical protein NC935_07755 [Candidatus Omnitrophica bacterium]|nr:hypothetical protein [Candidatus Omnitrophota bacterium]
MKKNILIGICGGIASYKICELVRLLIKDDFKVKVMMTESATKFITPLVFQTLSGNPVYLDMFCSIKKENIEHINLSDWAQICVIAPATANTISKIACGISDNLLTTVVCALSENIPVLIAPAMNENMWKNPIIKANIAKLKKLKKYIILDPVKGRLACGKYGDGRLAEPIDIYKKIRELSFK